MDIAAILALLRSLLCLHHPVGTTLEQPAQFQAPVGTWNF